MSVKRSQYKVYCIKKISSYYKHTEKQQRQQQQHKSSFLSSLSYYTYLQSFVRFPFGRGESSHIRPIIGWKTHGNLLHRQTNQRRHIEIVVLVQVLVAVALLVVLMPSRCCWFGCCCCHCQHLKSQTGSSFIFTSSEQHTHTLVVVQGVHTLCCSVYKSGNGNMCVQIQRILHPVLSSCSLPCMP